MTDRPLSMLPGSIDGSKSPNLIPDATAYRIFFRALTSDNDIARQTALLKMAGLSNSDLAASRAIGDQFQVLREKLIQDPQVASNGAAVRNELLNVGNTLIKLVSSNLTPVGIRQLDLFIKAEKSKMIMFVQPAMTSAVGGPQ